MADSKPKRLALWSSPRCLSTAMVMSFGNYGNVEVFNELYSGANTFGPERQIDMPPLPFPVEDDMSFGEVKALLEADYPTRDLVFLKDHAIAVSGKYDQLPEGFSHAFLIRNPEKTVSSGIKLTEKVGFTAEQYAQMARLTGMKGFGFGNLVDLVDHLESWLGKPPVILDADDLQRDPEKMLRAFCQALDLPFRESLLKWDAIKDTEIPWHTSKSMLAIHRGNGAYENALKSTGWVQSEPKPADISGFPKVLLDIIEEARPFYEILHARRLKPDN
ncbi:branched-chain-amino-acid aminotransferase-like protein 2 isoform X2 [Acanthaster planci]|uniref:Branched-chain-amino-acid aminotransferase-like protein 2 isoform X2 n=1 Tax=Acanthaster planci TaxID=133434 RepID=A0A8B7YBY5_ACAPL|nr:branched-chain-amino-acid aminotransferase-like protein 2 isoform X2 [Acanthaster planci]XP_022090068.1 branched-chain-amino-acid aminotransferase-like protein 2 isoform X2 [Acanthaster planci]XP_022090069.1 branched-chain-amino-acid aminotransferase-like protein 2 isoform X2 [Acanthaster planci]XP_022090071.1 branched-chain-amino-acid aminotransferase-like protein 2 isoform X2 [Acanthaster planci]XP_022090072.1 branched-chain-amino-acid aminotransferase-like protein 2 isoform X2 [Acanthaste